MKAMAETSTSTPSPDSYIGSFISLTSKSDIRYEGILYSINTDESSIRLRNVRSFGTEGRRKDGLQVPPTDKIYEFILFRGSDIKDLLVKASPPSQAAYMQNDSAFMQQNYLHPPTPSPNLSANLHSFGSMSAPELNYSTTQLGLQAPSFQSSLPTYQTGVSCGPWSANVSGISAPQHWQGYYPNSQEVSHLQPSLMKPSPDLSMLLLQQRLPFSGTNASLPSGSSNFPDLSTLFPFVNNNLNFPAQSHSLAVPPIPTTSLAPQISPFSVSNEILKPSLSAPISSAMLPPAFSLAPSIKPASSSQQNVISAVNKNPRTERSYSVVNHTDTRSNLPKTSSSGSKQLRTSGTLVAEDEHQLFFNDEEVKPPLDRTKSLMYERPTSRFEANNKLPFLPKEPILPLPTPAYQKSNESILRATQSSRGLGRGSGNRYARPASKFTEEFDFTKMNAKFNKNEVWGNLGKIKGLSSHWEDGNTDKTKDEFFDAFACDTNIRPGSRTKFLDQLKIDTETFGDFQSQHSTHVGSGLRGLRGGGRGRGPYRGRSYGHSARGRGYGGYN